MRYSKEKLIDIVRPYFKKNDIKLLHVTEDGNVFYENAKAFAQSHAKVNKLKPPYIITSSEIKPEKKPRNTGAKKEQEVKESSKKEAEKKTDVKE